MTGGGDAVIRPVGYIGIRMGSSVRDKIVEAALDRFHTLGFNGCGVQEIVDKAGVPKGSFYNYFKAKELLAVEVLKAYAEGSRREMLSDKAIAPVKRLRAHFEFLASRYARFGYSRGCLIGNIAAETSDEMPIVRKALARALANWTELVAGAIRDGQADGSIDARLDAEEIARFLINSWEGAVIRMKIVNSKQPLDDFFSVAFPLFHRSDASQHSSPKRAPRRRAARRAP
jgi:TetR/AcrR family transcriptional regulator, transcriptional repressor for nem operon